MNLYFLEIKNNLQVTVPRYRENSLITQFSLLCPGISQNFHHHQLTLYKGQVLGSQSYFELCDSNILNIVYDPATIRFFHVVDHDIDGLRSRFALNSDLMEQNGELYVPPIPGKAFTDGRADGLVISDRCTQLPWESEILQSFAGLTKVTYIKIQQWDSQRDQRLEGVEYQIKVGNWRCTDKTAHHEQCASLKQYNAWYLWTKESFKIQKEG